MRNNDEYFVEIQPVQFWKRLAYFLTSLFVLYFAIYIFNPYVKSHIRPYLASFNMGEQLFLGHLLLFSLGGAALTYLFLLVSAKLRLIKPVPYTRNLKRSMLIGLMGGLSIAAFMILVWVLTGRHFQFAVNWYSIGGNLFSDFYEEVEYRALLVPASIYLFRSKWAAFFVSALIMAFTHSQYPLFLQVCVGVSSFILAMVYYEAGNLLAPWLSHELGDIVLDAVLVM